MWCFTDNGETEAGGLAPQRRVPTCVSVAWLVSNLVVSLDLPEARFISTGLLLHDVLLLTAGNSCINPPNRSNLKQTRTILTSFQSNRKSDKKISIFHTTFPGTGLTGYNDGLAPHAREFLSRGLSSSKIYLNRIIVAWHIVINSWQQLHQSPKQSYPKQTRTILTSF